MSTRSRPVQKSTKNRASSHRGDGHPSSARLLYDRVTALPTLPLFLGRIQKALNKRSVLGLMTISIIQNDRIEQIFGWETFDALIRDLAGFLVEVKPEVLREEDAISEVMISGNAFVILLAPPRDGQGISYGDMEKIRRRIQFRLSKFLSVKVPPVLAERLGFYVGCATLEANEFQRTERLVYQGLDAAFADSLLQKKRR